MAIAFGTLRRRNMIWYGLVAIGMVLGGLAEFGRIFWFHPFDASSSSMAPTIAEGDAFLASMLAYRSADPQRGDVVVFVAPHDDGAIFIKRVIGVPGDRIQLALGVVSINGKPAQLRPLGIRKPTCADPLGCETALEYSESFAKAPSHTILLSDPSSPPENSDPFVVPPHAYFVVGDNRDNSLDSRFGDFGFIDRNAIRGKAVLKYFDAQSRRVVWQKIE